MPSQARSMCPFVRSSSYFSRASVLGIEKLMPWYEGPKMAALIPTIWPSMFTSGPPLLPGFTAASVCKYSW